MAKNQKELVEWSLKKAEEYLASATMNLIESRTFPAAEEIFRAAETCLEAMLYSTGITQISYPGKTSPFKGRLALQMLVRDNLVRTGKLTQQDYDNYLGLATELHQGGYMSSKKFKAKELEKYLDFAERLFKKAGKM